MTQKASNKLIGAFIVGALLLVLSAIMVFGSGRFFTETERYVLFFQGSVKGLNVGSPVLFRGVKIGSVVKVVLEADIENLDIRIPVVIEIEPGKFKLVGGSKRLIRDDDVDDALDQLVRLGLRGQLQSLSLVTGQLVVELDFHKDSEIKLVGVHTEYPEIPTVPSPIEQLAETFKKFPLQKMAKKLMSALDGLDALLTSPELQGAIKDLSQALKSTNRLVSTVEARVDPVADEVEATVRDARKLVRRVDARVATVGEKMQGIVDKADAQVDPMAQSIKTTAETATLALQQAMKTLEAAERELSPESKLRYQFNKTLQDLAETARSIRIWAEYLERHPEALIRGKE